MSTASLGKSQNRRTKFVLILGPGKSGKSTLFKQLKQIYGYGFDDPELDRHIIQQNIVYCMRVLLRKSAELYEINSIQHKDCFIDLEIDTMTLSHIQKLTNYSNETFSDPNWFTDDELSDLAASIQHLWSLPQIRATFNKRGDYFSFYTNADYYFDKVDVVFKNDYMPSTEDYLKVRVRTSSIPEAEYEIGDYFFRFIDIGGTIRERKKWIHRLENTDAVIFIASLTSMDEVLFNDESRNGMDESIRLWYDIIHHKSLRRAVKILVFNKDDLFREWLMNTSKERIRECLIKGFIPKIKTWRNGMDLYPMPMQPDTEILAEIDKIMHFNNYLVSGYTCDGGRDYDYLRLPMEILDLIILYFDEFEFEAYYDRMIKFIYSQFNRCNDMDETIFWHIANMTDKHNVEKIMWDNCCLIKRHNKGCAPFLTQ